MQTLGQALCAGRPELSIAGSLVNDCFALRLIDLPAEAPHPGTRFPGSTLLPAGHSTLPCLLAPLSTTKGRGKDVSRMQPRCGQI